MKKLWQLMIMSILATLLLVGCNGEGSTSQKFN